MERVVRPLIISLVFLGVALFVLTRFSGGKSEEAYDAFLASGETDSIRAVNYYRNLYREVSESIKRLESFHADVIDTTPDYPFMTDINGYAACWSIYKESQNGEVDSILKKGDELLNTLSVSQSKVLPKLRKAYALKADKSFWEHDIEVIVSGANNSIITFTGGHFAANKNIKAVHEIILPTVTTLRFKKVIYKWYSGDKEYSYYDLKTQLDTDPYYESTIQW